MVLAATTSLAILDAISWKQGQNMAMTSCIENEVAYFLFSERKKEKSVKKHIKRDSHGPRIVHSNQQVPTLLYVMMKVPL